MPTLEKPYLTPCDLWELHYGPEDHLGSTRMVIDGETASFTAREQTFYYSYGNMHEFGIAAVNTREKFTGKEFDQEGGDGTTGTGIEAYHFGARLYDPEVGMWLGADPLQEYWNHYSYVGGNPINLIDVNGLQSGSSDYDQEMPPLTVTATDGPYPGNSYDGETYYDGYLVSQLKNETNQARINFNNNLQSLMSWQNAESIRKGSFHLGLMGQGENASNSALGVMGTTASVAEIGHGVTEIFGKEYQRQAIWNNLNAGKAIVKVPTLSLLGAAGRYINYVGAASAGFDILLNGPNMSNGLDAAFAGISFAPGGWTVSGSYFIANTGVQIGTGTSIGGHIENGFTNIFNQGYNALLNLYQIPVQFR
jgi:RHS repeat-associated protein